MALLRAAPLQQLAGLLGLQRGLLKACPLSLPSVAAGNAALRAALRHRATVGGQHLPEAVQGPEVVAAVLLLEWMPVPED